MQILSINWWAVLVCVAVSMVSGFIWYNPKTFFLIWWKAIGKRDGEEPGTGNMGVTWFFTVLASLVQAIAIAVLLNVVELAFSRMSLLSGMLTGVLLWLGIIAPTYLVNKLFAGHGFKAWAIEAGNHLLNFALFGAILGVWR